MDVAWKVRGIRGAITVEKNSVDAIAKGVTELLDDIEKHNKFKAEDIVCVFFSATPDLNAIFPAAIARKRQGWDSVPLLDLQQMDVSGSLEHCIRILLQVNSLQPQSAMNHSYLREAEKLRPDLVKS